MAIWLRIFQPLGLDGYSLVLLFVYFYALIYCYCMYMYEVCEHICAWAHRYHGECMEVSFLLPPSCWFHGTHLGCQACAASAGICCVTSLEPSECCCLTCSSRSSVACELTARLESVRLGDRAGIFHRGSFPWSITSKDP